MGFHSWPFPLSWENGLLVKLVSKNPVRMIPGYCEREVSVHFVPNFEITLENFYTGTLFVSRIWGVNNIIQSLHFHGEGAKLSNCKTVAVEVCFDSVQYAKCLVKSSFSQTHKVTNAKLEISDHKTSFQLRLATIQNPISIPTRPMWVKLCSPHVSNNLGNVELLPFISLIWQHSLCEVPAVSNGCSAWRALDTAKTVTRVP